MLMMTLALNLCRGVTGRTKQASITCAQSAKQTNVFQERRPTLLPICCGIYLKHRTIVPQ